MATTNDRNTRVISGVQVARHAMLAIAVMATALPAFAGQATSSVGIHTPGSGFKVADTDRADLSVPNSFEDARPTKQRQDPQVNKVLVYFQGWLMSPQFRYLVYAWTPSVSRGPLSDVLVAGNVTYAFDSLGTLGAGINSLTGGRSTEGNLPFWFGVDDHLIADEFVRPSYTTGLFARREITKHLRYVVMWGDNLRQLGVEAGQLANDTRTFSGALIWMPTTSVFGANGRVDDAEGHDKVATRFGINYKYSDEGRQEQPGANGFDKAQIRRSYGTITTEALMVLPRKGQVYLSCSKVFGNYGKPSDVRAGVNVFPGKNPVVRWSTEFIYLNGSPVGVLSLPYTVGGNGPGFTSKLLVNF